MICVYSDLSEAELKNAPENVRNFFINLPKENTEFIEVTEEAYLLADKYLAEKVVGQTSADDCRHIATATINKVDILVSWNFKHIVNVFRIRGYNSINYAGVIHHLTHVHPKKLFTMKTKSKKEKTFDTVKVFREIKEKIAKETEKMTFQEFKEYLNKNKLTTAK